MEEEEPAAERLCIPVQTKIDLVIEMERRVCAEKSVTLKAFCREKEETVGHEIQPSQLRRWKNNLANLKKAVDNSRNKKTELVDTKGRKSQLCKLDDKLLPWMQCLRAHGKQVSVRMTAVRAKKCDPALKRKKRCTLFQTSNCCGVVNMAGVISPFPTRMQQDSTKQTNASFTKEKIMSFRSVAKDCSRAINCRN